MERVAVRRTQVRYAVTRHLSCRRACALLRVARSAPAYAARRPGRDAVLVAELQRLAAAHPRYGYRRMWALLRRRGHAVNPKRVHRLWRGAGRPGGPSASSGRERGCARSRIGPMRCGPTI
jgi:putative transposase